MRNATLLFLIDRKTNTICLGMKKRGFGASRWNGFGGKVNDGEEIEDAAIRETFEETNSGITIDKENLKKVATLNFRFPHKTEWNQQVHVFFVEKWDGNPNESEEMRPEWFNINDIPYEEMWSDDIHWLPQVLSGKILEADFSFNEKDQIIEHIVTELSLS
jgi:8-oxo-dGTP pyrophosphatase MutT (NUDIX family)